MIKLRIILILILIIILGSIFWAQNINIDIVAEAPGKIIPSDNVKTLQHLEGGIIKKINVKEGSLVKKDDILIEFQQIASKSEVEEIKGRLAFLEAGIITYKSLIQRTNPVYPDALKINYPDTIENFFNDYKSKLNLLNSEINLLKEKINADKKEITFASEEIIEDKTALKLFNKQIKISSNLRLENLTSEITHLDLLKNLQILKTKIIEGKRKLEVLKSNINIHKKNIKLKKVRFDELMTNQIKIYLEEKEKFTQRFNKYNDQLGRKLLISPIDGMIKTMNFFTEGGVIKPGENILDIVPNDDKFIVKSKLSVSDIGFIKEKQNVQIKLAGSHSAMFQPLQGKVKLISPDSISEKGETPYYQIFIELEDKEFSNNTQKFKILPGLEVICSIIIAKRNLLNNIFGPFKIILKNSLRENIWLDTELNKTILNHFSSMISLKQ